MKHTTPYVAPNVTVDMVVFEIIDNKLQAILIQRPDEPFRGSWALPGGYNASGETTLSAIRRVVATKAGISIDRDLNYIEQLYTFDSVANDPRGHAIAITYWGCGRGIKNTFSAAQTAAFPINNLPNLAFDHATIIAYAHQRLMAKLTYTNIAYSFLPDKFTLSELQNIYEIVFDRKFDKRNFRKKLLGLDLIHEASGAKREGAYRPAQLYRFDQRKLKVLSRSIS